jgi:hypothetical protein
MHRALFHRPPTGRNKLRPYENNANDNWVNGKPERYGISSSNFPNPLTGCRTCSRFSTAHTRAGTA